MPPTSERAPDRTCAPPLNHRPHLALSARDELVGVFWSPPFEGPLLAPAADVPQYYDAYRRLYHRIEAAPAIKHRLQPGEMAVFNNRRMLHGRHGFRQRGGARRHLRGCYVNIDEFANRCTPTGPCPNPCPNCMPLGWGLRVAWAERLRPHTYKVG